ncbi:MAG TPA: helix-turn-helix domain-containing protein, partial [Terriglobales bacterium]|nr:helix-turn-helix domain-containing protein [Terriglobales bacterium]
TCTLGATLFHLANLLYREAEHLSPQEATAMIEAYFDIWSACIVPRGVESSGTRAHVELCSRIETFIEEHLADASLNPATIAAAAGLSVRHLHRLFAHRRCTVGDWIRERRLERCRRDLADPRFCGRTITDIAFYWGFSESAHFSRSFKKQFGVSPRAFRSQPWIGATVDDTLLGTTSPQGYPN